MRRVIESLKCHSTATISTVRFGLSWWWAEIVDACPARLARFLDGDRNAYIVRVRGADLMVRRRNASEHQTSTIPRGSSETLPAWLEADIRQGATGRLEIPPAWVLRRQVELPLMAQSELQAATSFLLDRISPFQADQVLHATRLMARDRRRRIARAELAILPHGLIDPLLSDVRALGIPVSTIGVEGDTGKPAFSFSHRTAGSPRARPMLELSWTLVLAASLLVLVLGPPIVAVRTRSAAEALAAEVVAAQSKDRQTAALRTEIEARTEAGAILSTRQAGLRAIEALDAISSAIPDGSWLFRLDLDPGGASLAGFSSDVPGLLSNLSVAPFESPELTAPVVTGLADRKSRFELRVLLKDGTR